MKRIIIKIVLLFCLVCLTCFCWFKVGQMIPAQYTLFFNASILDKVERAKSIDSPKILVVGGSNIVFGINSEYIESEFSMPVVNMGVNAGMMMEFQLNVTRECMKKGDIVVLGFEYAAYASKDMNPTTAWYTIENYDGLWDCVPSSQKFKLLRFWPYYFMEKAICWVKHEKPSPSAEEYVRSNFNIYGDFDLYREKNIRTNIEQNLEINEDKINIEIIDKLNDFCKEAEAQGITVLLTFPSADETCVISTNEEIEQFEKKIRSLVHCTVISNCSNYLMESKYFYDTNYHLNTYGADLRTRMLIEDIKKYIEK